MAKQQADQSGFSFVIFRWKYSIKINDGNDPKFGHNGHIKGLQAVEYVGS
jgi:hypothetical protein